MGVDIRIYAQRNCSFLSLLGSEFVKDVDLFDRFDVEAAYPVAKTGDYFLIGLSNSGKLDLLGVESAFHGKVDLIAADAVGSESACGDQSEQFGSRIRLDGVVNPHRRSFGA